MSWHVGIDIGGTFTDAVAHDPATGATRSAKVWSVPDDAETTIGSALEALGIAATEVGMLTFGTTVATNAIIQGRLARVALIASSGFGDVLDIARQNRRHIYDLATPARGPAPVAEGLRFELAARMAADGQERSPFDASGLEAMLGPIRDGAEAVAVSLLHAYANPAHEQAVAALLRPHVEHVSLSHRVWPQAREYERTLATVLNAGVMPLVDRYVNDLARFLPASLRLELFHSSGGMASPEAAVALPLSLALSGPAAGVAAAATITRQCALPLAISLDMGGTTTDVCLIRDGAPEVHEQGEVGAWRVNLPMLAVHSIGAGGGSLVDHDAGGLRVGPQSAGSSPGPACYGRGGEQPTLTDAAVLLGYLQPDPDADSAVSIDCGAARRAYAPLAGRLRMDTQQVARGVVRVANASMARAIRHISVDRGVDTRDCALIAFGGAGPMYAAELAREVGIDTVVVPASSSLLSAVGCLVTAPSYARQRTVRVAGSGFSPASFQTLCAELAAETCSGLLQGRAPGSSVEVDCAAFMRYQGQSYAIDIPCTPDSDAAGLGDAFRRRHHELYGYSTDEPWELQSLRVTARMPAELDAVPAAAPHPAGSEPLRSVTCVFEEGALATPVYTRDTLAPGSRLPGPALVVDATSTTVVPPGCSLQATAQGHLHIRVEQHT